MMREPSSFQKLIQQDVGEVFINLDEFASLHLVDGKKVKAVIAPDQNLPVGKGYTLGVSESSITIYAVSEDIGERKEAGESMSVDGGEYIIDQWNEHQGMVEIMLSQTRST